MGGWESGAEEAGGVSDEEGAFRWGEVLGGDDEVAFVLAVCGVEDYEGLAVS